MLRKFTIKVILLAGFSLLLFLISIFIVPELRDETIVVPDDFLDKMKDVEVVICGDSRADRQLIPAVIKEKTNLNVINIAATSQDLYTWSNSLLAAGVSGKMIVISASFFQINDGANNFTFFNLGTFSDMTIGQKIRMYGGDPIELMLMQTKLAYASLVKKVHKNEFGNFYREINVDYNGKECINFKITSDWFKGHWWYNKPEMTGIKKLFLERAFYNLSLLKNCKILIYNGPVSDSFMNFESSRGILNMEKKYDSILASLSNEYGFHFKSFLADTSLRRDDLYYDPQHLCQKGARVFSEKVADLVVQVETVN